MCCGRRVRAATAIAAAFSFCCAGLGAGPVRAGDSEDARVILFSGRDLWRNGAFTHTGLLIAPGGFEQDGLMLKTLYGVGVYRYYSGYLGEFVKGFEGQAQFMPGWRHKRGNLETKVFFGLDLQHHRLWPADAGNRLSGNAVGLRFAAEFWYDLAPDMVVFGDLSLSSVASSNSGRIAFGRMAMEEMLGGFYLGPEVAYFGSDGYRHLRLGFHITSMKTEANEWSAAAGWAGDNEKRASPYVRLNLSSRIATD